MSLEIKVPTVGESINEVTLSKWLKNDGDYVQRDEVICELESDKATFELNAEQAGVLKTNAKEGDTLKIGDVVANIDTEAQAPVAEKQGQDAPKIEAQEKQEETKPQTKAKEESKQKEEPKQEQPQQEESKPVEATSYAAGTPSPAASKIMSEQNVKNVNGTGKSGRVTKADVLNTIKQGSRPVNPTQAPMQETSGENLNGKDSSQQPKQIGERNTRREKMSTLRKTIGKRLVAAKNQTAMLTTFNEVDLKNVMEIRAKYKEAFQKKHGVGLGFISFFTKAVCNALQEWQAVNATIDGEEILYHDYVDISIAVSTPKGLTTPVIRNAD